MALLLRAFNVFERRKVTLEHLFSHINLDGRFDYVLIFIFLQLKYHFKSLQGSCVCFTFFLKFTKRSETAL